MSRGPPGPRNYLASWVKRGAGLQVRNIGPLHRRAGLEVRATSHHAEKLDAGLEARNIGSLQRRAGLEVRATSHHAEKLDAGLEARATR